MSEQVPYTQTPLTVRPVGFGEQSMDSARAFALEASGKLPIVAGCGVAPSSHGPTIGSDFEHLDMADEYFTERELMGNARLLAAGFNSYARHFGPDAVAAAEDDVLGASLEALKLAQAWLANCAVVCDMDEPRPLPIINAILARVPQESPR